MDNLIIIFSYITCGIIETRIHRHNRNWLFGFIEVANQFLFWPLILINQTIITIKGYTNMQT